MLPDELKSNTGGNHRSFLRKLGSFQAAPAVSGDIHVGDDDSDETKRDAVKRSTTSDHRHAAAGGPDWLANVKHWLGQAVSGDDEWS